MPDCEKCTILTQKIEYLGATLKCLDIEPNILKKIEYLGATWKCLDIEPKFIPGSVAPAVANIVYSCVSGNKAIIPFLLNSPQVAHQLFVVIVLLLSCDCLI